MNRSMVPVLSLIAGLGGCVAGGAAVRGAAAPLLNPPYQLLLRDPVALSPRLSLILPTGDEERGLGEGTLGFQGNIPLSVELTDRWVTHWNLGMTYVPRARGPGGAREGPHRLPSRGER